MRSLGLSLGWILGILGLFLGMYQFAILIIVVGGVLGMIYMIVAMMSYPNTKKDMIAYVVLITILVATFISYFVLKEFVLSSLINNGGSTTNFLKTKTLGDRHDTKRPSDVIKLHQYTITRFLRFIRRPV